MSLVNDMLRDLDRRRKESSGGTASVSLTPAPELPPGASRRPVMLYLIAALIAGAGIIAYFWIQQGDSGSTRELNIAPRVAVEQTESPVDVAAPEQDNSDITAAQASGNERQSEVGQIEDDESSIQLAELEANNSPASSEQSGSAAPALITEQESQERAASERLTAEVSAPEGGSAQSDGGSPRVDTPSSDLTAGTANLNQSPAEEVKNAAQRTPEERDVLAVQQALQLIAQNNITEAYVTLEQEILDNRYAHQARETYAKLLINEGNLRGALELTESGLELSPNHPGFKKIKARLLIAQGELINAVDLLLTRAPPVDEDLEYHEILATAQLASRDYEGALISYTGLVRLDQNQGKWWYGFAASQDSLGNSNAARQGYSRAMSLSNLSANLRRRSQERLAVLSP